MRFMTKYCGFRKPAHRLAGIAAVLAAALALAACSARPSSDSRPLVLTTFTVMKDMAKSIAGLRLPDEYKTTPGQVIND